MNERAETFEFGAGDPFTVLREAVVAAAFVPGAVGVVGGFDN